MNCPNCGSANTYFSKKHNAFRCEDCEHEWQPGAKVKRGLKIFFSYGHDENEPFVLLVKAALEKRGHKVWLDKEQIAHGADWRRSIETGLKDTDCVLSFLSAHAVRQSPRGVCLDELAIAVGSKKAFIKTVLLEVGVEAPSSVSAIQWLDMSRWREYYDKGGKVWKRWFDACLERICAVVESDEAYELEGEITFLKKRLMPDLSESKLCYLLQKPFTGRQWLFDEVEAWRLSDNDRPLAVFARPGVGKSAFAAQYYHFYPDAALAAVFCEWGRRTVLSADTILRTVAFQLAARLADYRKKLCDTLADEKFSLGSGGVLADNLFGDILQKSVDGGRPDFVIVLDGLDELGDDEARSFTELINECSARLPHWIKFLFLSRKNNAVISGLKEVKLLDMDDFEAANERDVRAYFADRLARKLSGVSEPETELDRLTQASEGVFLYAELISNEILNGERLLGDGAGYPRGLNGYYTQWFARTFPDKAEYQRTYAPALGAMIASPEPIPEETLEALFGNETEYMQYRRKLKPFLKTEKTAFGQTTTALFHKSLGTYLSSEAADDFFVSAKDGARLLADVLLAAALKYGTRKLPAYEAINLVPVLETAGRNAEADGYTCDDDLLWRHIDFIDEHEKQGQYTEALKLSNKASELSMHAADISKNNADAQRNMSVVFIRKGDLFKILGNVSEAKICYEFSLSCAEKYQEKLHTEESDRYLAFAYKKVGNIHELMGDTNKAMECYQKSRHLREALSERLNTAEAKRDLSIAYDDLGDLYKALGDIGNAKEYYEKSLQIAEKLDKKYKSRSHMRDLSISYNKVGNIYKILEDYPKAKELYIKSLAIRIELNEGTKSPFAMHDLAISYKKLGEISFALKDMSAAKDYFEKCLVIVEEINSTFCTPHTSDELALSCYDLSCVEPDIKRKKDLLDRARSIYSEIAKKFPDIPRFRENEKIIRNAISILKEEMSSITATDKQRLVGISIPKGMISSIMDISFSDRMIDWNIPMPDELFAPAADPMPYTVSGSPPHFCIDLPIENI